MDRPTSHPASFSDDEVAALVVEQSDKLLAKAVTPDCIAAAEDGHWAQQLWEEIETAGLPVALVSQDLGGHGLPLSTVGTLLRRAAYYNTPVPLAETILAQSIWTESGGNTIDGTLSLAPCNPADRPMLESRDDGYALSGRLKCVPWGMAVSHVLVITADRDDNVNVVLAPTGSFQATPSSNLAREPRPSLSANGLKLGADAVRPAPADFGSVLELGAYVRAEQMVGAMERAIDHAVVFANERVQFGRTIGQFQAVQHALAEAAGLVALATAAVDVASANHRRESFALSVAVAKAAAGDAAGRVTAICHQVLGAIGFAQEHNLHLSTRRLLSWREEFGNETYWRTVIGREICQAGGAALWQTLLKTASAPFDERAG